MTNGSEPWLFGVWGTSASDVFAVGAGPPGPPGVILHYDGASWTMIASSSTDGFDGVWGSSSSDVYVVGSPTCMESAMVHFDGVSWATVASGINTGPIYGVGGTSATDIFAVGMGGAILHYAGPPGRNEQ
jgi:hypothetical protein